MDNLPSILNTSRLLFLPESNCSKQLGTKRKLQHRKSRLNKWRRKIPLSIMNYIVTYFSSLSPLPPTPPPPQKKKRINYGSSCSWLRLLHVGKFRRSNDSKYLLIIAQTQPSLFPFEFFIICICLSFYKALCKRKWQE